jgi:hypothetical protein
MSWARQTRPYSRATLVNAAQPELAEASGLLDLPEHRLGQLLARAIRGGVAGPDLLAHGRHALAFAFAVDRMLGASGGDGGVDVAALPRLKIGVRATAGVGRGLLGPAAHVGFDPVDHRRQLISSLELASRP